MTDLKKLAKLISAISMSDGEREAFIKLIPKLPAKHAAELTALFEKQVRDMRRVETEGKKLVAKVLDGRKIEALKKKIKSRVA